MSRSRVLLLSGLLLAGCAVPGTRTRAVSAPFAACQALDAAAPWKCYSHEREFAADAARVAYRTEFENVSSTTFGRCRWSSPDRETFFDTGLVPLTTAPFAEKSILLCSLPVRGAPPSIYPGEWSLTVYYDAGPVSRDCRDDGRLNHVDFTIDSSDDELAEHYPTRVVRRGQVFRTFVRPREDAERVQAKICPNGDCQSRVEAGAEETGGFWGGIWVLNQAVPEAWETFSYELEVEGEDGRVTRLGPYEVRVVDAIEFGAEEPELVDYRGYAESAGTAQAPPVLPLISDHCGALVTDELKAVWERSMRSGEGGRR